MLTGLSFTEPLMPSKQVAWPICVHSFVTGCSVRFRNFVFNGKQIRL